MNGDTSPSGLGVAGISPRGRTSRFSRRVEWGAAVVALAAAVLVWALTRT
jgi:hypothetical protein